ncbi:uncharacterized protein LOC123876772 [Maniola jurtina]|uniref:uncharacterized protein LOC123876772 n=1 Tax=Maniola jurtina TaxID=191418 RepID=UPI001E68D164|nr:uncharacterized protein LOC123876772 [Maniola jurtina]
MSHIWSMGDDEILINFVKIHEPIYNIKCKDYRNNQLKQKLWSNIGEILNKTDSDCSKRWCYVRDYYIRRKGKPGIGSSGEAARRRANLLSFLDGLSSSQKNSMTNVVDHENQGDGSEIMRNTQDNSEGTQCRNLRLQEITIDNNKNNDKQDNTDTDDTNADCNRDSKIKIAKKRKYTFNAQERLNFYKRIAQRKPTLDELDENDLFFSSMAKIVKKLPRSEQAYLRMQIGSIVGNAELRHISNELPQSREYPQDPLTNANDSEIKVPTSSINAGDFD